MTARPRTRNLIRHCIVPTAARNVRSMFVKIRIAETRRSSPSPFAGHSNLDPNRRHRRRLAISTVTAHVG